MEHGCALCKEAGLPAAAQRGAGNYDLGRVSAYFPLSVGYGIEDQVAPTFPAPPGEQTGTSRALGWANPRGFFFSYFF